MAGGMAAGDREGLAARIRRLREARGMTRGELVAAVQALGARTERNDVVRYEECDYYPRLPMFAALAEALDVSLDVLWYGEAEAEWLGERREHEHDTV
jgi:transcriptional regulator with XRE-family HTH domain